MALRRRKNHYQQLTKFERGSETGQQEGGFSLSDIAKSLSRIESILQGFWEQYLRDGVTFLGFWTVKTVLNPISGQVFDEGHGESGVLHSPRWHDGDWMIDGIREAWLRCFVWMPGRRSKSRQENIERVKQLVENDCRLTKRMIAEGRGFGIESVHLMLTEDLGKRKLCCRPIPHRLTHEQMEMRLGACGNLIDMTDGDRNFLNNIVTDDESWYLKYDPESKRQSLEWRSPSPPEKYKVRTTLIVVVYVEVLKRLLQCMRCVHPEYAKQGSWTLLHHNARPHTTLVVQQFLAANAVVTLDHPPPSFIHLNWHQQTFSSPSD
ncbi:mariner Mos1 transposase [Trichonephila clavipes]|nr:mariner Mos1 transposase [Trichonephila clavipes]